MLAKIRGLFGNKIKDKTLLVPIWNRGNVTIFIDDVKLLIIDYLSPSAAVLEEFQNFIHQIYIFSPSNLIYQKKTAEIIDIANIIIMCRNYTHFESEYKYYSSHPDYKHPIEFASFGLHALLTDFNYCSIENMKKLIKLMPYSTDCELGALRCRNLMTPLDFACLDENISCDIITYLFSVNGNMNHSYLLNNFPSNALGDLISSGMDSTRREFITRLFVKC